MMSDTEEPKTTKIDDWVTVFQIDDEAVRAAIDKIEKLSKEIEECMNKIVNDLVNNTTILP
jgi:hypothetical protein